MTKAPERIWAQYSAPGWRGIRGLFIAAKPEDGYAEFVRTDLSNALIGAAYEAAAADIQDRGGKLFDLWHSFFARSGYDAFANRVKALTDGLPDTIAERIRALTPADARAALERVAQSRWYRMDDPENPPPKDGTRFMAFEGSKEAKRYECWWNEDGFSNWDGWLDDWDTNPEPTHWTPLLAPPEDEG